MGLFEQFPWTDFHDLNLDWFLTAFGDLMKEAGGELLSHYKDTAVMGFFEVAMKIGKILDNFRIYVEG